LGRLASAARDYEHQTPNSQPQRNVFLHLRLPRRTARRIDWRVYPPWNSGTRQSNTSIVQASPLLPADVVEVVGASASRARFPGQGQVANITGPFDRKAGATTSPKLAAELAPAVAGAYLPRDQRAARHRDNLAKDRYLAGRERKELAWQSLAWLTGLRSASTSF
jgi:hypothetical protein